MRETETRCLDYFAELAEALITHRYYERVFHLVVDRLARLFHCQTCAIILIDPESEYLHVENQYGLSRSFCKQFRSRVAAGAVGELLWKGRPVLLSDAGQLPGLAEDVKLEHPFASCALLHLSVHNQTLGYMHLDSTTANTFDEQDLPLLTSFAAIAAAALYQNRLFEENLHLDRTDHETGLERFSSFSERLQQHIDQAGETGEALGLLIFDIDNYKTIANTYGHEATRRFLREFGTLLSNTMRSFDLVCRYGPDEVMILLPNSGREECVEAAEQVCSVVRSASFTEHGIRSTVSGGLVCFPEDAVTMEKCITCARSALFEAQRSGRDRIQHYASLEAPYPA